ncbi:MAG: hypothetical protein NDI60_05095 [Elusimicrobiales bacterium]|nr:hypothetical protein [Elusimicrobiales bacterium]
MLKSALVLLLAAAPVFAEGLPDFNLNAIRARDILEKRAVNPDMIQGIMEYDRIPGAPQPVCVRADGRPMPKFKPAETYRLFDPANPVMISRNGYVQINSSTKIKVNKEKGELAVYFPDVEFGGGAMFEGGSDLFVRITGTEEAPAISWATVICSNGSFLGYKGATFDFPQRSGTFSISETFAMGAPKTLIARTHRWLAGGLVTLEDLCTAEFKEKMKDARAETLPEKLGKYNFDYNPRKNALKVTWENK